jgi:hypothetical protein
MPYMPRTNRPCTDESECAMHYKSCTGREWTHWPKWEWEWEWERTGRVYTCVHFVRGVALSWTLCLYEYEHVKWHTVKRHGAEVENSIDFIKRWHGHFQHASIKIKKAKQRQSHSMAVCETECTVFLFVLCVILAISCLFAFASMMTTILAVYGHHQQPSDNLPA